VTRLAFLFAFALAAGAQVSSIPAAPGGNATTVNGIAYNSSGAATANTTSIQAVLTAGGHVLIDCPPAINTETDTIPAAPYQISVANSGPFFLRDTGVTYAVGGAALSRVASGPTTGQYSSNGYGVYTFASGDVGASVVIASTSTSIVWLNAALNIGSNTHLEVTTACHLEHVAGTYANVIQNNAWLSPWTTEYNNSGAIATGPQAVIWGLSTPAWVASTSYAKGNYVVANGNIYWQNATSCTSAGSGGPSGSAGTSTGPTGTTGAAITDNTCSWYYVTVSTGYPTYGTFATVYYPNSGLAANDWVTINPQPDNGSTNYWSGGQTAHTRGGPCDSAYFGTFQVYGVNDANYITVILKRAPGAAFSGIPMNMKAADHDIEISGGGALDFNEPGNATPVNQLARETIILVSAARVTVDNIAFPQADGYGLVVSGLNTFRFSRLSAKTWTHGDLLKVYGSFDGVIDGVDSYTDSNGEISVQTGEPSAYSTVVMDTQDLINIKISNISGHAAAFSIYATVSNLYMDNVIVDGIATDTLGGGTYSAFRLVGTPSVPSTAGTIIIKNATINTTNNGAYATGPMTVQSLILENVSSNWINGGNTATQDVFAVQTGFVIDNLVVRHFKWNPSNSRYIYNAGTITNLTVEDGYAQPSTASNGVLVYQNSGTISNANFTNLYLNGVANIAASLNGTAANLTNVYALVITAAFTITGGSNNIIRVSGSHFTGMYFGIARYNATATVAFYSGGGNYFDGSSVWWTTPTGTDTILAYGFDIPCDVTKLARVTGEFCSNTNTAPGSGTLTTAGPIMNQGTSTGSWFLMANPTGQVY
jgi:hypothetical protein